MTANFAFLQLAKKRSGVAASAVETEDCDSATVWPWLTEKRATVKKQKPVFIIAFYI
jgi:hypothetical protein